MDYASAVDRTTPRGPARPHKRSESLPCLFACEAVDDDGCEDVSFRLVAAPGAGRRWAGVRLQRSGEALATLAAGLGAWSGSEDLAEAAKRFVARVAGREDSERGRAALALPCDVFLAACGDSLKFAEWAEAATVVDGYAEGRGGSRRWDLADSVVEAQLVAAALTRGEACVVVTGGLDDGRETTVLRIACVTHDAELFDIPFHMTRARALHAAGANASPRAPAALVLDDDDGRPGSPRRRQTPRLDDDDEQTFAPLAHVSAHLGAGLGDDDLERRCAFTRAFAERAFGAYDDLDGATKAKLALWVAGVRKPGTGADAVVDASKSLRTWSDWLYELADPRSKPTLPPPKPRDVELSQADDKMLLFDEPKELVIVDVRGVDGALPATACVEIFNSTSM